MRHRVLPFLLLADLALVIAVLALASDPGQPPLSTTTTVPMPTAVISATDRTGKLIAQDPMYVCVHSNPQRLLADPHGPEALALLNRFAVKVQQLRDAQMEAVVALVFTTLPESESPWEVSTTVGTLLQTEKRFAGVMDNAVYRPFRGTADPRGTIVAEIYHTPPRGSGALPADDPSCPRVVLDR